MALKIDEIMDLSLGKLNIIKFSKNNIKFKRNFLINLDDYIAISKKSNTNNNNAVTNNNTSSHEKITHNSNNNDAKFGRRKGNIDDEEEEDDEDYLMKPLPKDELEEDKDIEVIDTGIWKGPDSSLAYLDCNDRQNDLREKLNNNGNRNTNGNKVSSVQFRMMAPNNSANRPRGLPTLLPLDVQVNNNRNWVQNNRNGNRRNRGHNRGYRNFQRGFNNGGNNSNAGPNGGGVSNGRVQKNWKQQDIER